MSNRSIVWVAAIVLSNCASVRSPTAGRPIASPGRMVVTSPVRTDDTGRPHVPYETAEPNTQAIASRSMAEDPGQFALRVQDRLLEIQDRVHDDVWHGNLSPEAEEELLARRRAVQKAVRRAAADGVITRAEERQVEAMVRDLEQQSYQYVPMPRAWGGGPRYWR